MTISKNPITVEELESQVKEVFQTQEKIQTSLQEVQKHIGEGIPEDDPILDHFRHLTMQLRLDNEDVILSLLQMNKSYCVALGIDPLKSEATNLERMNYLLGEENVKLELTSLHNLMDKLERTLTMSEKLTRAQENQRKEHRRLMERMRDWCLGHPDCQAEGEKLAAELAATNSPELSHGWDETAPTRSITKVEHELATALELQTQFQFSIEQLTESFESCASLPKFGLIFDYLAGLEGPVSRFYQAYQNGLSIFGSISQSLNAHKNDLIDSKQHIAGLMNRLNSAYQQQRQLLKHTHKQEHHFHELAQRLEHKIGAPELVPVVTETNDPHTGFKVKLEMFPS